MIELITVFLDNLKQILIRQKMKRTYKLYELHKSPSVYYLGSFPFVPPPSTLCAPVKEHVPLHSKSICKNMARASGGANRMHQLSCGGTNGKNTICRFEKNKNRRLILLISRAGEISASLE